jgi:putative FmdB family regulatory protein
MPIYEYRCSECGFQKEYLQKVSDPKLTECPSCGKSTFSKMLTAAGFQLKGSGWYVTDFKNSGSAASAKSEGGKGKSSTDNKKDASTESKPESASTESKSESTGESKSETKASPPSTAPSGS